MDEQIRMRVLEDQRRHQEVKNWNGDTWAPTLTEQQKREHDQYVTDNKLPF